ncbi:MAG: DUF1127 domain-containing protein [Vitreimonas sp.]
MQDLPLPKGSGDRRIDELAVAPRIERNEPRCLSDAMTWRHLKWLLREWRLRSRSRREIAKLDPCAIKDLGICASQMKFEAQKPFWRA